MSRRARAGIVAIPQGVTKRGNQRAGMFFSDEERLRPGQKPFRAAPGQGAVFE